MNRLNETKSAVVWYVSCSMAFYVLFSSILLQCLTNTSHTLKFSSYWDTDSVQTMTSIRHFIMLNKIYNVCSSFLLYAFLMQIVHPTTSHAMFSELYIGNIKLCFIFFEPDYIRCQQTALTELQRPHFDKYILCQWVRSFKNKGNGSHLIFMCLFTAERINLFWCAIHY
jgi:hypothetical protein